MRFVESLLLEARQKMGRESKVFKAPKFDVILIICFIEAMDNGTDPGVPGR